MPHEGSFTVIFWVVLPSSKCNTKEPLIQNSTCSRVLWACLPRTAFGFARLLMK